MNETTPTPRHYRVRPGGLMRCCLMTLEEASTWHQRRGRAYEPPKEGDKIKCGYCSHFMVYRKGAWEWAGGPRA
jgi:hypothetical protein